MLINDGRWKKDLAGGIGLGAYIKVGIKQRRRQGTAPHRRRDRIYKVCAPLCLFLGFLSVVVFALYA